MPHYMRDRRWDVHFYRKHREPTNRILERHGIVAPQEFVQLAFIYDQARPWFVAHQNTLLSSSYQSLSTSG